LKEHIAKQDKQVESLKTDLAKKPTVGVQPAPPSKSKRKSKSSSNGTEQPFKRHDDEDEMEPDPEISISSARKRVRASHTKKPVKEKQPSTRSRVSNKQPSTHASLYAVPVQPRQSAAPLGDQTEQHSKTPGREKKTTFSSKKTHGQLPQQVQQVSKTRKSRRRSQAVIMDIFDDSDIFAFEG